LKRTAIILAGGRTGPQGVNRALLRVGGVPLIRRQSLALSPFFEDVMISCKSPETYEFLGLTLVKDEFEPDEAIIGLYSALKASETELNFCISCDLPIIHLELIRYMLRLAEKWPAVAPESDRGPEPLYAVYHKSCEKIIGESVAEHRYSLQEMLERIGANIVTRKEVRIICGKMNALYRLETPEDIEDLESMLKAEED
jgi:molybdopterin-guanine dinucleotide biosynthesis protein A